MTIDDLLKTYSSATLVYQRRGHASERSLRRLLDPILEQPVETLTFAILNQLVGKMTAEAPVHGERALGYVGPMLSWAEAHGHIPANPLHGFRGPKQRPARDRILSLEEVRGIYGVAGRLPYPFGPAFQLLVLIPATREIVGGLRVADLGTTSGGGLAWRVERQALPSRLSVPAAHAVRAAVACRIKGSDLVFSTTGRSPISGWSRAKARLDDEMAAMGLMPEPWRLNDLRSSFASIAREQLKVDAWAIERCLGRINKFATPLLREWADSPELRLEADLALDRWAALVTG